MNSISVSMKIKLPCKLFYCFTIFILLCVYMCFRFHFHFLQQIFFSLVFNFTRLCATAARFFLTARAFQFQLFTSSLSATCFLVQYFTILFRNAHFEEKNIKCGSASSVSGSKQTSKKPRTSKLLLSNLNEHVNWRFPKKSSFLHIFR